jgi:hypothetical protein
MPTASAPEFSAALDMLLTKCMSEVSPSSRTAGRADVRCSAALLHRLLDGGARLREGTRLPPSKETYRGRGVGPKHLRDWSDDDRVPGGSACPVLIRGIRRNGRRQDDFPREGQDLPTRQHHLRIRPFRRPARARTDLPRCLRGHCQPKAAFGPARRGCRAVQTGRLTKQAPRGHGRRCR